MHRGELRKIVLAPDSFKGTLTAAEVCRILAEVLDEFMPETEVVSVPVSDGGEGMVDAFLAAAGGTRRTLTVTGPAGDRVEAAYGVLPDGRTAVIEMAQASGLLLVKGERSPLDATSYGTGELIADAVQSGCGSIILGIGGSATNDGGTGALAALGARFLDADENDVKPDGRGLAHIAGIDVTRIPGSVRSIPVRIACDVANPLLGPDGASAVYGPQKGADPAAVKVLESGLEHYNAVITKMTGTDRQYEKGIGAAGGIGLSLKAFLNAESMSGIDLFLDGTDFSGKLEGADLVITGEGRIDRQSRFGKAPVGVARRAKAKGIPVIAIAGAAGEGCEELYEEGITAVFSTVCRAESFDSVRRTAAEDLRFLARSLVRAYMAL